MPSDDPIRDEIDRRRLHELGQAYKAQMLDGERWFMFHIHARSATLAISKMRDLGYDVYYPMIRKMRVIPKKQLSRSQRASSERFLRPVLEPLFTRYSLVRFDLREARWHSICRIAGVSGIACNGDMPWPLPDADVERIRSLEVDGAVPGETPIAKIFFEPGEIVRFTEGPFYGHNGTVCEELSTAKAEDLDESAILKLSVDLFGRRFVGEFLASQVEKV